jgi:CheY-like chemotaxis protein
MTKILIVEDDPMMLTVYRLQIKKKLGYDIDTATDEQTAVEQAQQKYDLILMDIGLGDTDGFTVTQAIRSQCPLNQNTPVIALTSHREAHYRERAKEVGMKDYLTKPLDLDALKNIIDQL